MGVRVGGVIAHPYGVLLSRNLKVKYETSKSATKTKGRYKKPSKVSAKRVKCSNADFAKDTAETRSKRLLIFSKTRNRLNLRC
jgi:hypothetical protein